MENVKRIYRQCWLDMRRPFISMEIWRLHSAAKMQYGRVLCVEYVCVNEMYIEHICYHDEAA